MTVRPFTGMPTVPLGLEAPGASVTSLTQASGGFAAGFDVGTPTDEASLPAGASDPTPSTDAFLAAPRAHGGHGGKASAHAHARARPGIVGLTRWRTQPAAAPHGRKGAQRHHPEDKGRSAGGHGGTVRLPQESAQWPLQVPIAVESEEATEKAKDPRAEAEMVRELLDRHRGLFGKGDATSALEQALTKASRKRPEVSVRHVVTLLDAGRLVAADQYLAARGLPRVEPAALAARLTESLVEAMRVVKAHEAELGKARARALEIEAMLFFDAVDNAGQPTAPADVALFREAELFGAQAQRYAEEAQSRQAEDGEVTEEEPERDLRAALLQALQEDAPPERDERAEADSDVTAESSLSDSIFRTQLDPGNPPPRPAIAPHLMRRGGDGTGIEIAFTSAGTAVVGRSPACGATVVDAHLTRVSAEHATIRRRKDGSCEILDGVAGFPSRNGTAVGGKPAPAFDTGRGLPLRDGDLIALAGIEFVWKEPARGAPLDARRLRFEFAMRGLDAPPLTFQPEDGFLYQGEKRTTIRLEEINGSIFITDTRKHVRQPNPRDALQFMADSEGGYPHSLMRDGVTTMLAPGIPYELLPGDMLANTYHPYRVLGQAALDAQLERLEELGLHDAARFIRMRLPRAETIPALKHELARLVERAPLLGLGGIFRQALVAAAAEESELIDRCLRGDALAAELSAPVREAYLSLLAPLTRELEGKLPPGYEARLCFKHALAQGAPPEERYHAVRAAVRLQHAVEGTISLVELEKLLFNSPLELASDAAEALLQVRIERPTSRAGIEELMRSLNNFPEGLGLRQKAWELVFESDARSRSTAAPAAAEIPPEILRLIRRVATNEALEEMIETVYRVLERGLPLEHVTSRHGLRAEVEAFMQGVCARVPTAEWPADGRNYFSGEAFDDRRVDRWDELRRESSVQRRYRFARMYLNYAEGRPLLGAPTAKEMADVTEFVEQALGVRVGDYGVARDLLRDHFSRIGTSPLRDEIHAAIRATSPEMRFLLVSTYFGPFRFRQVVDVHSAVELARALGEAGLHREIGVTFKRSRRGKVLIPHLTLGDLEYVSPADHDHIFILHTHPVDFLQDDGRVMGAVNGVGNRNTIMLADVRADLSTLQVLFSETDIRLFMRYAAGIVQGADDLYGGSSVFRRTPDGGGIFSNWMQQAFGASVAEVKVDSEGLAVEVRIRYALNPLYRLKNRDHLHGAKSLRKLKKELGIPVIVDEVSYDEVQASFPAAK